MGTGAGGFLLFSFAFSSVLSSPEAGVVTENAQAKWSTSPGPLLNNVANAAIKRVYVAGKSQYHLRGGNIAKREVAGSLNGKIDSFGSQQDKPGPGGRSSFRANEDELMSNGKRARFGFTGMRGKKGGFLSGSHMGRRNPSRNPEGSGLSEFLGFAGAAEGPGMGLGGVRGKRYDAHYDALKEMVFHGMRGKKDYYPRRPYGAYALEWGSPPGARGRSRNPNPVKRDPSALNEPGDEMYEYEFNRALGFLGMRGKKSPESWDWGTGSKRRTQSSYFGSKGKKAQSGFFGMRGKKSSSSCLQVQGERGLMDGEQSCGSGVLSPRRRIRRGSIWLRSSKKAKNSFFAVRGKKSSRFFKR